MLVRMTQELKRLYSNLGLPESILNSVASMAIIGMSEESDDAALSARAGEESVREMLKSFQSHVDKVRGKVKKVGSEKNKDEEDDDVPSWFKTYEDRQLKAQTELLDKIKVLEGAAAARDFDSMVERVGQELGLKGAVLDLCKSGLSSDMDEVTVRNKLGASKKTLIDEGVHFEERLSPKNREAQNQAELEEARAWAKMNVVNANEE